jgi:hypothetical protein
MRARHVSWSTASPTARSHSRISGAARRAHGGRTTQQGTTTERRGGKQATHGARTQARTVFRARLHLHQLHAQRRHAIGFVALGLAHAIQLQLLQRLAHMLRGDERKRERCAVVLVLARISISQQRGCII